MRTRYLLAFVFGVAGCASRSAAIAQNRQQQARGVRDSAQIVGAAWDAASAGHLGMRAAVLWSPTIADTGQFVRISDPVKEILARDGVPLAPTRVVGDDTVHFRLTSWASDSTGELLEFRSTWSTVIHNGSRACRTGSGNRERFQLRAVGDTWNAKRHGAVIHGDRECVPIPPP